jgi:hypothetical protein
MPLYWGWTTRKKIFKIAVTAQSYATKIKEILQLNSIVDVKKLVSKAPPIFPALPDVPQKPIKVPLPLFPNQFAKIAVNDGHPTA